MQELYMKMKKMKRQKVCNYNGQDFSKVPSNTNKISDNVLNTALNYKKEQYHINREDRESLINKINNLETIKDELNKKIVRVDNLINQLSVEEKYIIKTYYFEKSKWDYVSQQYCIEFQKPKSINQLINIRNEAIKSMLDILNTGE